MGKTYVIDFETYWSNTYTLSRMGPIEYVRDQRFVPQLLAAMRIENQYEMPKGLVTDNIENMRAFLQRADKSNEDPIILAGHNMAGFDALVVSEYFGIKPAFIVDTITMMNWIGYSRLGSRSHAALCELLDTGRKKAGTVVSCGKQWPQEFTPEEQQFFIQNCHDDAEQCALNLVAMMPYMSSDALLFGDITARMATEPVFELDEKLLEEYIAEIDAKVEKTRQELLSIFHFTNEGAFLQAIRSAAKFAVMLTHLGVEPPMKVSEAKTKTKKAQLELLMQQAKSVEEQMEIHKRMETELPVMTYAFSKTDLDFLALREHPDMRVQLLVNARLDHNTSIDRSRAERLLFFARQHKPIPIMLSAYNAHTGRYTAGAADEGGASDKLQFQNLSKRDPNKAKLRQAIKAPAGYKVVACDSGQVEARCLAWEANETRLVAQFREGRDPYSELAETVFQVPHEQIFYGAKHGDKRMKMYRNVGKTAILSCVGGDTEVLTDSGWKLITEVTTHDRLWDGKRWVHHDGVVCNGIRSTVNVGHMYLTDDHLVFAGGDWKTVKELREDPELMLSAFAVAAACLDCYHKYPEGRADAAWTKLLPTKWHPKIRSFLAGLIVKLARVVNELDETREKWVRIADLKLISKAQKVYDILNCGPRNRFLARHGDTVLLCHNCGYGVGAQKFSDTLSRQGAKLDPDPDRHREMAFNAHAIYRASHPNIVKFWDLCGNVIRNMEAGYSGKFGGPNGDLFEFGTKEMGSCGRKIPYVLLPNGYHLWYPGLRVENDEGKAQYYYDRPRGKNVIKTKIYSGAMAENITQGFAFAILVWQACRMREAGLQLAANIHDSFAVVVPEDKAEETGQLMYKIMTTCPPWASTLPLFAEVEIGTDFSVV